MAEQSYDEWRQFVVTSIAVLKSNYDHLVVEHNTLHTRLDNINNRVNNGFSDRLSKVEQNGALFQQQLNSNTHAINGFRDSLKKVLITILTTVLLSAGAGYIAVQTRTTNLEKQIETLTRQLGQK